MAQLLEALRYKSESRGFDSRWCHWNFSHNLSGRTMARALSKPTTEMSTRNVFWGGGGGGEGCRYVALTTLPPSCADYLEIWEPETPGTLRACTGL